MIAKAAVTPIPPLASVLPFIPEPLSVFRRIWPLAGLVAAIVVNMAWMGFPDTGFSNWLERHFSSQRAVKRTKTARCNVNT